MLTSLKSFPLLALTLAVGFSGSLAHAGTTFKREFAPQDGLLAPVEKANRGEICLNGSWQFQPVALPAGYQRGKSPVPDLSAPTDAAWVKTPIRIPSPWNVNGFPDEKGLGGDFRTYPSYPDSWKSVQMGWLRKTFNVPANWRGRRLVLHFDAVAGDTQVIVNGQTVGRHDDIFLPFDVDVTSAIQPGNVNTLLVGVRRSSLRDNQGKYGRRPYQGGSFWGQHIAGIWQDVYLEATPLLFIENVFVQPQVDKGSLQVDVTVRNNTAQPQNVTLNGTAYPWISQAGTDVLSAPEPRWTLDKTAALQTNAPAQTVPAGGSAVVTLTANVGNRLKFWTPETPNLYGLVCGLKSGPITDAKYTRFGWRQLTFKDGKTLLNGQPIVMKGDSWHFMGIPQMTRRYPWAWYRALKDANLNAVRLHAQPYPAFYLDVADEMGIMVLDETAIWASDGGPKLDDPAYWADTNRHVRDLVLRDRNHPSVFGWSVSNEVMAIIRGVFHGPREMQDQLVTHFGQWREICLQNDPTRQWISADGEDDGNGSLGTYVVHYGGSDSMRRAAASGKPWGVGEAGPAYYATPQEIEKQSGNPRSYLSFQDRMEGVAVASYKNLLDQRQFGASYRSVFNLAWYGLKPLALGMEDTTRAPALTDGIFFPAFVEGKPGVQPERLGPYCTTLNPGYDPSLKLYETWPLFDAIRAAQAEPIQDYQPANEFAFNSATVGAGAPAQVKAVRVLAGSNGVLTQALSDLGVTISDAAQPGGNLLFIDGVRPPTDAEAKAAIQKTLDAGGTVFVWGAAANSLSQLNQLLPAPLQLTDRTASSLVPAARDALIASLTPASLYFSELNPPTIATSGLDGAFVNQAIPLLVANNTEWTSWNRQGEATKTARIMRSEREAKPSGVVLAQLPTGRGRIVVCNIPAAAQTAQATVLNRAILTNLGVVLGDGVAQRNMLDPNGVVTRALAIGRYAAPSVEEAMAASPVAPNSGPTAGVGGTLQGRSWTSVATDTAGSFDLKGVPSVNAQQASSLYLSFWLNSPKDLGNLLLDPNLPMLELATGPAAGVTTWMNGNAVSTTAKGDGFVASPLLLQQGWNHILVKIVRAPGDNAAPTLKLQSNQAAYLNQLQGAQQTLRSVPEPPKVVAAPQPSAGLKSTAIAEAEKGGGIAVASERDEKGNERRRFTAQGNWNYPGVWTTPEPENRAIWEANLPEAGKYRAEIWYDTDPNNDHATQALVRIAHADGEQQTRINQRDKTTQWVDLGTYRFNKGWAKVTLEGQNAGGNLIAGLVRFVPVR